MRRSKRFSIKLVAVAFAAAAFAAPSAQAMPDLPGDEVRALQEAKTKSVRAAATVKSTQRIRLPRRPIREYEPE
jgi:uncharacterized lipoprotein YbaY